MKNFGWIASSWATALLLGLPVLALIFSALSADGDLFRHLVDTVLLDYLRNTSGLVLGVVLLSLLFGVPTAWLVAMCQVPGRRALQWALMLPMAMPSYIVAYVYTDLLDYSGPLQAGLRALFDWQSPADYWFPAIRSLGGAAWVLALVLFPYVYLLARASFLEQSVSLIHSSRLLGCTPWQSFCRLSLPLARPAIMVGASLVAMETLADFATVHFFAINTLTTAIYDTWLGYGSLATAARLSCLMLLAVVLLIALERRSRQRQQVFQKSMGHEQPLRYLLKGANRLLAGLSRTRAQFGVQMILQLGGYFADTGTGLAELRGAFLSERGSAMQQVLNRAVARGEVDPAKLTPRVVAVPFDLFRQELLMTLKAVPDEVAEGIVDEVFLPLVLTRPAGRG